MSILNKENLDQEQMILRLFEDADRALMAADAKELSRIFADDYLQYDESGKSFTKKDLLENLTSGQVRYVSMISTGRRIRVLTGDIAVVHGSEDDVVERNGECFSVRYVYLDVVARRDGRWQVVASQLAKPAGD
jgi:uncharacterized protein (TIGR02246 family)